MGGRNRKFVFDGGVTGSVGVTQLRALPGTTGSITFTTDLGFTFIAQTQIFYGNIEFKDSADSPTTRDFSLSAVEVI